MREGGSEGGREGRRYREMEGGRESGGRREEGGGEVGRERGKSNVSTDIVQNRG